MSSNKPSQAKKLTEPNLQPLARDTRLVVTVWKSRYSHKMVLRYESTPATIYEQLSTMFKHPDHASYFCIRVHYKDWEDTCLPLSADIDIKKLTANFSVPTTSTNAAYDVKNKTVTTDKKESLLKQCKDYINATFSSNKLIHSPK